MARVHWKEIESLAKAHHLEKSTASIKALERALKWWWVQKYNRPFKDPLLASYTLDELIYEFLRHHYAVPENDPRKEIIAKQEQRDEDAWIQKQMASIKNRQAEPSIAEGIKNLEKAVGSLGQALGEEQSDAQVPDLPDFSTTFTE